MARKRGKSKKFLKRRRAALKGWRTRRRNERKRSLSKRKTRRRRKTYQPKKYEPSLHQYLVTTRYEKKGHKRRLDFLVNAESEEEARRMVRKELKLTREGFTKWEVQVSENPNARPRKSGVEKQVN